MKKFISFSLGVFALVAFVACEQAATEASATSGDPVLDAKVAGTPAVQTSADNTPKYNRPEYQVKAEAMARTNVDFVSEEYNFGQVESGDKVPHKFKFTNTGASDLVITNVKPSCGCTTPSYSTDPIAAGESGYIDVVFNSAGKTGVQNKTITVTGNFEGGITKVLRLTGEVLKKE
ncbi:MAG: DUF1573 domain-containing protein [Bacteroidota bacterium]